MFHVDIGQGYTGYTLLLFISFGLYLFMYVCPGIPAKSLDRNQHNFLYLHLIHQDGFRLKVQGGGGGGTNPVRERRNSNFTHKKKKKKKKLKNKKIKKNKKKLKRNITQWFSSSLFFYFFNFSFTLSIYHIWPFFPSIFPFPFFTSFTPSFFPPPPTPPTHPLPTLLPKILGFYPRVSLGCVCDFK